MSTSQTEPRRGRGRPRTPGAEERILEAALEEYGERGWAGFTMDAVARRAGVGKSTVYLRWQDKDSLLTDAVSVHSGDVGDVDTGSLRGDLLQLAHNLFGYFLEPAGWAALRITVDKAGAGQSLGRFSEEVSDVQVAFVERILRSATERGQLRPGAIDAATLANLVYGAVVMHVLGALLEGRRLSDADIASQAETIVDMICHGLEGA